MPKATLTPLGVIALGLLRERAMHPYEMLRLMQQRRADRLVTISKGTLYHTVARLERAGLVAEVGTDRDGNLPERTTYEVTDAGRTAAAHWVRRELPRIDRIAEFRVALSEAHELPRAEAVALLVERRDALVGHLAELRAGLRKVQAKGVPLQFVVDLAHDVAMYEADLAWLDTFLTQITDPAVPWGAHEVPAETLARLISYRESTIA